MLDSPARRAAALGRLALLATWDTLPNPKLHDLIKRCDVVFPWRVGRYQDEESAREVFRDRILEGTIRSCSRP